MTVDRTLDLAGQVKSGTWSQQTRDCVFEPDKPARWSCQTGRVSLEYDLVVHWDLGE